MTEAIKTCIHHGSLMLNQLYKRKTPLHKNKMGYRYECHQCRIASANKQNKKLRKYYKKRSVDDLLPYYIKDRLVQAGFARDEVTPELIELKRAMLQLHRKVKDIEGHGKRQKKSDTGE